MITKEYPPEIYGGAGVHVAELVSALRRDIDVTVRAFGAPRDEEGTFAYRVPDSLAAANPALQTLGTDLEIVSAIAGADVVHSHTWYANFAGHLASQLHGIPHVLTAHSLEPLRPWKAEQLGGGYAVSSGIEKLAYENAAAVIAVSAGMRADILRSYPQVDPARVRVIHNGIDVERWRPVQNTAFLSSIGMDPDRPSVVFVGRITRQKGLPYLLQAARLLPPEVQLILCAGAPDTPEIMAEVQEGVRLLQQTREGVVWIERMLPRDELSAILAAATTFVCPSVYEPLGIVNLEAMACGGPRGRPRDRRHPRGRGRRRHWQARPDRAGAGRYRHTHRPGALRRRPRGGAHRGRHGPRAGTAVWRCGPGACPRAVQLGRDRRRDPRALRGAVGVSR